MSRIALTPNASGTGTLTIAAPNTNTDRTLTLPDATGTVNISGLANEVPAGSAGAPAIYPTGDTNTGIFFPATDTVAVATAGTARLRVDSSGNVGIGNSNPTARLEVVTSSGTAAAKIWSATNTTPIADLELQRGTNATWGADAYGDYRLRNDAGALLFQYGESSTTTERMRIDSSGNVGVGTTTPTSPLHVYLTDATTYGDGTAALDLTNLIRVQNGSQVNDTYSGIQLVSENGAGTTGMWTIASVSTATNYDNHLVFHQRTGSTTYAERARFDEGGGFLVGATSLSTASSTDTGFATSSSGFGAFQRASNTVLSVMRQTNDGTIIDLRQGGTSEGTISVSGTTVSYNGGHLSRWAQFPDNSRPELLKGTVMSNLDQMSNWDGEDNEQLNCVEVSAVEGDANVAGVFVAWDSTDDGYNDILLAMTGDMVIRIGAGVTVARGDLLMSAGDGTAKPQGDDIVRSKTIAKVTSTHVSHTYADGSYAVPCVLMAC